ncbi:hypothetical protein TNCV_1360491 [Trichonephila clavipes]|nr:hypothetical protein TNCV_1360491 [Trichonephila clavipes]
MTQSTTNNNEFRSKDGTVVRIPDADFNIVPRSVTKNTTPCSTPIRTTRLDRESSKLSGSLTGSHNRYRSAHRVTRDKSCLSNEFVTSVDVERMALTSKDEVIGKRVQMRSRNLAPLYSRRAGSVFA